MPFLPLTLMEPSLPMPTPAFASLTLRERQVAYLVAAAYTNKQIAAELRMYEGIVEKRIASIVAKLDIDRTRNYRVAIANVLRRLAA